MMAENKVSQSLKTWFFIHFLLDVGFGLPLLFIPSQFLSIMGWGHVDPIFVRLFAAAILGIAVGSWLARNSGVEIYRVMLNIKLIWVGVGLLGMVISLWEAGWQVTWFAWFIVVILLVFIVVWTYFKNQIKRS